MRRLLPFACSTTQRRLFSKWTKHAAGASRFGPSMPGFTPSRLTPRVISASFFSSNSSLEKSRPGEGLTVPANLTVSHLEDIQREPEDNHRELEQRHWYRFHEQIVRDGSTVWNKPVLSLSNREEPVGQVTLGYDIFGIPPRNDILQRVVRWQLAKKRRGLAKTKDRGEVSGGGKKPWKQKGTGRARAGSIRSPLWRGGGRTHGPLGGRDWSHNLPKKVRKLGLKAALSTKLRENRLVVVDTLQLESYKTGNYVSALHELGWKSALCIEGDEEDNMNAKTGLNNVHYVDILPSRGANVYNILKRELLVLTTAGLKDLEERLAGP
jgi:large subunit ribosomal protein L4